MIRPESFLAFLCQVKDLKSRVADMEGQSRLPAGISLLEGKVQELEERLRSEERCAHTSTHAKLLGRACTCDNPNCCVSGYFIHAYFLDHLCRYCITR